MNRKRIFLIAGILLASSLIIALILSVVKNNAASPVSNITMCDQNSSELCIVTFGADGPGYIVINFQLPKEDYPIFNVKGINRGITYDYSCQAAEDKPMNIYCNGPRTPLGEQIEIEVYSIEDNLLLARGKIVVSSIVVWTPSSIANTPLPSDTPSPTVTATAKITTSGTVVPTQTGVIPTQTNNATRVPPQTAYPNPNPTKAPAYPNP